MTFLDDDRPKKPLAHEIGQDLSTLSVDEIDKRVALLREEIARLEAEKVTKASGKAAAENLFKS
ncbi:DUF1192 family protein [Rhizobiales bacterium RZME27]|uniref:DUF1192 family protein n=1 Tax=Endobacterium cereale TaxID=2663029 RepID=A0A6A8AN05_9HYPH|nr:DUF1192 domain-containing protein [Endobacterium cereale]MEB2845731.1 DUF1192 domain-containing protein [Endobacterium cereale]MQY50111.1 DUF1192 family protein [Endobacterium cereale]